METIKLQEGIDPVTGLPPSGHARDEVLKQRLDTLQEEAEIKANELEIGSIDEKALRPDREIQHMIRKFDILTVTNAQKGYEYCWVYSGQHGHDIWAKKAQYWEVVQGNDPECKEHTVREDTTRRVGDVILMRIRADHYYALLKADRLKAERQQTGIESELFALGEQVKGAIKVYEVNKHPYMTDKAPVSIVLPHRSHPAYKTAVEALNKHLIKGTVPGIPNP